MASAGRHSQSAIGGIQVICASLLSTLIVHVYFQRKFLEGLLGSSKTRALKAE